MPANKMSCSVFPVFYLLLFVCCQLCRQLCVAQRVPESGTTNGNSFDEFLKPEMRNDGIEVLDTNGQKQKIKIRIKIIESVFLVAANDVMVALADVSEKDKKEDKRKINVLSKFICTKNSGWGNDAINAASDKWISQLAAKDLEKKEKTAVIKSLFAFAEKEKIYHIMVSNDTTENEETQNPSNSAKWHVILNVGEVSDDSSSNNKKQIAWKSSKIFISYEKFKMKELLEKQQTNILPSDGFSFVIGNKKYFVFVIQTTETANKKNNIIAVSELKGNGNGSSELLFDENVKGCNPTFFQWKGELFKAPTDDSKDCGKQMMVLDFNGKTFKESNSSIARLRDFFKHKTNFVNTKIGDNYVLLFTQQKRETTGTANGIYLWMTDGTRVGYVGLIFRGFLGNFYCSILHTNDELFVLHQKYDNRENKKENEFVLLRLKEQLNNITKILEAWNKINSEINKLFKTTAATTKIDFTDGLVGYLSGTNENIDYWKDEYLNVNASVKNGAKTENGFIFKEKGAGALWPVINQQNDQAYNFTETGFTLLATVEIGKNNDETTFDNSLLGLILKDENNRRVGLLCSGGNWAVGDKTRILKKSGEKCEQEETYFVGLVLEKGGNLAIYVDGKNLNELGDQALNIGDGKNIAHFYFGADAEGTGGTQKLAKTDVTITNVLLYNLPIDEDKIKNIKAQKREKPKPPTPPLNGIINTQEDGKNTSENGRPSSTSATPTVTEKDGAEIKLCSFLKNDFTVFVLLLLVRFTLLARYA